MFLCSCGENVASKLFISPSICWHKLVPSAFICSNPDITILPRPHLGTQTCFAAYRGKNFACCFLVQSRPNTIANQQRIVIWHYEGRWNATCHDLSCLEAGHIGPFEDLSVLTKFALVQQVVRTCFCDCLTKCIARATRTNHKTTASLFS